jgi:hypothetical protein
MALVQRLASTTPAIISSAVRPAAGARVASFTGDAVKEIAISSETFFDSLPYEYTGGQPQAQNDDQKPHQGYRHQRAHFGALNATTEIFASLLVREVKGEQIDEFGNVHQYAYPSVVSRAIGIYELNNKIIHGSNPVLGTKISITL